MVSRPSVVYSSPPLYVCSPKTDFLKRRESSQRIKKTPGVLHCSITFTFVFRSCSIRFYAKRLTISTTSYTFETIYRCRFSKDVHRTKCKALIIVRLTHSLYTTNQGKMHGNRENTTLMSKDCSKKTLRIGGKHLT